MSSRKELWNDKKGNRWLILYNGRWYWIKLINDKQIASHQRFNTKEDCIKDAKDHGMDGEHTGYLGRGHKLEEID